TMRVYTILWKTIHPTVTPLPGQAQDGSGLCPHSGQGKPRLLVLHGL
ncbi:17207_t:CDS:1, partial [Racocetra fulgida]